MDTVKPDVSKLVARTRVRFGNTAAMSKRQPVPSGLYHARKFRGLSQDQLARESGVPKAQISKLETIDGPNARELTRNWAEKFQEVLRIPAERILFWDKFGPPAEDLSSEDVAAGLERPLKRRIKVAGYVGAGGQAHHYAVAQGHLDEIDASDKDGPNAVAVEIKGDSLGRLFSGWFAVYDDVRRPVTDDLIGRVCVVGLPDDRILVKKIERAGKDRFNLLSETEEPIRGVQIEWAAKVTDIRSP